MAKKDSIDFSDLEEKEDSKLKQLLVGIVLPLFTFLIIVGIVVVLLLEWSGVNTVDYMKKAPVISSFFPSEEELKQEKEAKTVSEYEQTIVDLKAELKDSEVEKSEMEQIIASKDEKIQSLEAKMKKQNEQKTKVNAETSEDSASFKEVIKVYEKLSSERAASIITTLDDKEAVSVLSNLKTNVLVAILEEMNATDAAKYTQLLSDFAKENENAAQ